MDPVFGSELLLRGLKGEMLRKIERITLMEL